MLGDARSKKFDAVIAKSVSQLVRNTVENLQTARDIKELGNQLILLEDNYDTEASTSKMKLESKQESKKDTEQYIHAFQRQIRKFVQLDIDGEKVMKVVQHRLIHKIEVHEDKTIGIHYNITPHSMGALTRRDLFLF